MKLCQDCFYCINPPNKMLGIEFSHCKKSPNKYALRYDLVSNKQNEFDFDQFESCCVTRSWGWFSARILRQCGKEGRFWKPK